jgi:hypothetical protein
MQKFKFLFERERRKSYAKIAKKKQLKLNGVRYHLISFFNSRQQIKWHLTPFDFKVWLLLFCDFRVTFASFAFKKEFVFKARGVS